MSANASTLPAVWHASATAASFPEASISPYSRSRPVRVCPGSRYMDEPSMPVYSRSIYTGSSRPQFSTTTSAVIIFVVLAMSERSSAFFS